MKFHPYCTALPVLEDERLDELAADIKKHGLREEIWTYQGMILDGRNRFLACQKANEKPRFREYKGDDVGALSLVVSMNFPRRHWTPAQRAMAVAALAEFLPRGGDRRSEDFKGSREPLKSTETLAKAADVSESTLKRAKKVKEHGSKPLQKAVEKGDIPLKKAAAVTGLPKAEQLAAAKMPVAEVDAPERPDDEDDGAALEAAEQAWRARMDQVLAADDKLAEMSRQLKEVQGMYQYEKREHDRYMNENAALIRQNKALQRKLDRLEKKAA